MSERVNASVSRLGVWKPGKVRGELIRCPERRSDWERWAAVDRIAPRSPQRKRVLWLGESVARGFFYDPAAPPARMLERLAHATADLEDLEVVDLAANGLTASELPGLMDDACSILEPDAIVLFAGNNWFIGEAATSDERRGAAEVFGRGGLPALGEWFRERYLPDLASRLMDRLARAAAAAGDVPVILVIPEFNLEGWEDPLELSEPLLSDEQRAHWRQLSRRASEVWTEGDREAAWALGRRMAELDRGSTPWVQRFLARIHQAEGRGFEAREALEKARDTGCHPFVPFLIPRCPGSVQTTLRQKAAEHGFTLVDLPAIFEQAPEGELPGYDLFLDYCHLSQKGLCRMVVEIAARLHELFGDGTFCHPPSAGEPLWGPRPEDEAVARFLAALHNARYGQSHATLTLQCRKALEASPSIAETMLWFLEAESRGHSRWISRRALRVGSSKMLRRHLISHRPLIGRSFAFFELRQAMADALTAQGISTRDPFAASMATTPRDSLHPLNLLSTVCSRHTMWDPTVGSPAPAPAFYRSRMHRPCFEFTLDEPQPLELRVTSRVPSLPITGCDVAVFVNSTFLSTIPTSASWSSHTVPIPQSMVLAGRNRIELLWPDTATSRPNADKIAAMLARSLRMDLRPIYGEIFTLTLSRASSMRSARR